MANRDPLPPNTGAYVVPMPRVTDALGASLRSAYPAPPLPDDLAMLLRRIDTRH